MNLFNGDTEQAINIAKLIKDKYKFNINDNNEINLNPLKSIETTDAEKTLISEEEIDAFIAENPEFVAEQRTKLGVIPAMTREDVRKRLQKRRNL